ncbi:FtsK/SpoIIIE domain-containing protein [Wenjunlia tyrosinilytica]|nr:FtsK/SpoIIIE domain-containing protein [Wenjunlia tyrosinilytica]
MQIRLTVLGPRSGQACDVLVTAPAGTPLSAVAGAISASAGVGQPSRSGSAVTLHAGAERLAPTAVLGHPPLVDGAAVSLHGPADDHALQAPGQVPRLQVVGGPDAGGVHLLHGGQVRIGRSAEADVPLDDPDVSRLHTAVTVEAGQVTVVDLGSTNGTTLDGLGVGRRPVPFEPGTLLRIGESTLTLEMPGAGRGEGAVPPPPPNRPAVPDGEGHLQVSPVPRPPSVPVPPDAGPAPAQAPGSRARALAKRLTAARSGARAAETQELDRLAARHQEMRARRPDPSEVLLTAIGPGPRLWERGPGHPDALTVRLGTVDVPVAAAPVAVGLGEAGVLGLAGPAPRVRALARSVVAQLAALHGPSALELVLLACDEQAEAWSWMRWLPQLRPAQGQDCRLLLGLDADQQQRRIAELSARLELPPPKRATVVVVDESSGRRVRGDVARLLERGPAAGIHALHITADPQRLSPVCGARAVLTGEVAAYLDVTLPDGSAMGEVVADAVSPAWAERFARALSPLREAEGPRPRSALPERARLLDALDLALATPAKISARWSELPATGGSTAAVLGVAADGRCSVDLAQDGPHLLVGGAPGSGKTELLRSVAASLAAADRPDRLSLVLVDGAGDGAGIGEGLRTCTDLPHVSTYLEASDPVRMRELAQALTAELNRREDLLDGRDFGAWQAERLLAASRLIGQRRPHEERPRKPSEQGAVKTQVRTEPTLPRLVVVVDDFDALVAPALGSPGRPSAGSMVRALDAVARRGARLGVHLVASTGRPERTSGGEVDEQARLRVALRTDDPVSSRLLVHVEDAAGLDEAIPGRGYVRRRDGSVTPFQAGRVSGRIPRTATLRPTVVPVEWQRMGDPPTRRPVRELGNGPTDLALLASALQRAAESAGAQPCPPLI